MDDVNFYSDSDDAKFYSDDDDDDVDINVAINFDDAPSTQHKNRYNFLKEKEIIERVEERTATVSSVLSLPPSAASVLLRHHRWNPNRLHDAWFSDEPQTRSSAGLIPTVGSPFKFSRKRKINETDPETLTCGICFDVILSVPADAPLCGHAFCTECWEAYIRTSIEGGPGCLFLRCPDPSCDVAVAMDMIRRLASREGNGKYMGHLVDSYVEGDWRTKWCPGPGCEYAIEFDDDDKVDCGNYDVMCRCSFGFCWNCTEESHRPVDCATVAKWSAKNNSESENTNWILAFTKPCPKCKTPIEKHTGCNHMTCRAPCYFQFCWLCLTSYTNHACNFYNKTRDEENTKRDKAKHSIRRYTHYFERWATNRSSEKKALADLRQMESMKIEKLGRSQSQSLSELSFVTEAWVQIVECRRILKWTYAFGYFLPEEELAKKQFFEYLQGEAEVGLERLHLCAEKDLQVYIDAICPLKSYNDFRIKLTGLTKVTKNYFENLVKALENGLSDVDSHKGGYDQAQRKNGPSDSIYWSWDYWS